MSDTGLTTDGAPVTDVDVSTSIVDDVLAEPAAEQAVFDRGYVESIRKEAARYRTEAQTSAQRAEQYDAVFGMYDTADQEVWFNLARTWAQDPAQAAQAMQQIVNGVLGEQMSNPPDGVAEKAPETIPEELLTPDKVKEMIEAGFQTREQQAAEQKAIDNVMSEVRDQGYDPNTAEGFMVLWNANNQTGGDIKAAAEMVKGYRQSIIDEYVQGRSSGRVALPSTNGGVQATTSPQPITNLEDARKAADAFLRERRGA